MFVHPTVRTRRPGRLGQQDIKRGRAQVVRLCQVGFHMKFHHVSFSILILFYPILKEVMLLLRLAVQNVSLSIMESLTLSGFDFGDLELWLSACSSTFIGLRRAAPLNALERADRAISRCVQKATTCRNGRSKSVRCAGESQVAQVLRT